MEENLSFLLKVITITIGIVSAWITTKVSLYFYSKRQDEHHEKLERHETSINSLNSEIDNKLSYKVAEERFISRKELDLRLEMVALKQQTSLDKSDEILNLLKKEGK